MKIAKSLWFDRPVAIAQLVEQLIKDSKVQRFESSSADARKKLQK
jgi:hypothetical protein